MNSNDARPDSPWYRVGDLCRLLDVGERCIWSWVASGRLPAPRRIGTRWSRWPREEIDQLLQSWGLPKNRPAIRSA